MRIGWFRTESEREEKREKEKGKNSTRTRRKRRRGRDEKIGAYRFWKEMEIDRNTWAKRYRKGKEDMREDWKEEKERKMRVKMEGAQEMRRVGIVGEEKKTKKKEEKYNGEGDRSKKGDRKRGKKRKE